MTVTPAVRNISLSLGLPYKAEFFFAVDQEPIKINQGLVTLEITKNNTKILSQSYAVRGVNALEGRLVIDFSEFDITRIGIGVATYDLLYLELPSATADLFFTGNLSVVEASPDYSSEDILTTTASALSLIDGIKTITPTAHTNLQVPTGFNMDTALENSLVNQSFEWSVINLATATYTINVTANTNHMIIGNSVVQANTSARFLTRKTAVSTFITYRI